MRTIPSSSRSLSASSPTFGISRMVKDDVYTSIHIEDYESEARDTKLGPEEILHIMSYLTNLGIAKHSIVLSSPKVKE